MSIFFTSPFPQRTFPPDQAQPSAAAVLAVNAQLVNTPGMLAGFTDGLVRSNRRTLCFT